MRIIGARTISADGQRWIVQEVAKIGIAEEPEEDPHAPAASDSTGFAEEPEEDPHAPAAPKLHKVTFTSQQTGVVRRCILWKPLSRTTEAGLEDAFRRSYSEAPAPPSP